VYPPAQTAATNMVRTVAGRRCRVYRYDKRVEYCVDGAGLVLAAYDGTTVDVARSVTITDGPTTAAELAASLKDGFNDVNQGSIRPLTADSAPQGATDWSLAEPPEGFAMVGRYAVVALSDAVLKRSSLEVLAGVVDVYVRGIDAVVIDRGGRLDRVDPTVADLGSLAKIVSIDLGALGTGISGIGGLGPFGYGEVRATPMPGRYVSVSGTLSIDDLGKIARNLVPSPGTGLRYTDG